jgi:hypothetical protein
LRAFAAPPLNSGTTPLRRIIPWHEITNIGDTTLGFLVVEKKYEPVPAK